LAGSAVSAGVTAVVAGTGATLAVTGVTVGFAGGRAATDPGLRFIAGAGGNDADATVGGGSMEVN